MGKNSNKKKENKETATGYAAYYISFLFFWALIGGLLTLSPYLSNKASLIGNVSIWSSLALPITILFSMDNKKPSLKTWFSLNFIIWVIFTYIVWAKASI